MFSSNRDTATLMWYRTSPCCDVPFTVPPPKKKKKKEKTN